LPAAAFCLLLLLAVQNIKDREDDEGMLQQQHKPTNISLVSSSFSVLLLVV